MGKKDPLGRGLSAILRDVEEKGTSRLIPVDQIVPNPGQPRLAIKEETLVELAASIHEKGLLQPILLRRKDSRYEIIAGERRFRASLKAGLREVPAIVKEVNDREALEIALTENLQREDLNPVEVATVYDRFLKEFDYTQEELARKIGIDRSSISNFIRLLKLPEWIKDLMVEGKLTQGHGRVLTSLESEKEQRKFVDKVLQGGVSVRDLEKEVKKRSGPGDSPFSYVEQMLKDVLKTKINITYRKNKGKLIIEFYSKEDLERIAGLISEK